MREPWVLDKRKTKKGKVWAVRFWDYRENKFYKTASLGIPITAKDGGRRKALQMAQELYNKELRSKQNLKVPHLLDFLSSYWDEGSDYIYNRNQRRKAPLSAKYIETCRLQIKKHSSPYPGFDKLEMASRIPPFVAIKRDPPGEKNYLSFFSEILYDTPSREKTCA